MASSYIHLPCEFSFFYLRELSVVERWRGKSLKITFKLKEFYFGSLFHISNFLHITKLASRTRILDVMKQGELNVVFQGQIWGTALAISSLFIRITSYLKQRFTDNKTDNKKYIKEKLLETLRNILIFLIQFIKKNISKNWQIYVFVI